MPQSSKVEAKLTVLTNKASVVLHARRLNVDSANKFNRTDVENMSFDILDSEEVPKD